MMTNTPPQPIANLFMSQKVRASFRKCAIKSNPLSRLSENQSQEIRVGKFRTPSLPHNQRVHRGNDEEALITRAERDQHVRGRVFANADIHPVGALPRQIEHVLDVDLPADWRLSIQPERQSVGWIRG